MRRAHFFGDFFPAAVKSMIGFGVFALLTVPLGLFAGFLTWAPTADGFIRNAAVIFMIPALTEEVVFRAPLLRWPTIGAAVGLSTAYVLWHPLAAWALLPESAGIFFEPVFLLFTSLFAGLASILTIRFRTIWPAVGCHWTMVLSWKQLFGGPIIVGMSG